jgi:C_GCAxxG_C_C family probable redox protein
MTSEERIEKAIALFKEGYNCSQSVAMAFADLYGIGEEQMSMIAASFGGGIGRMRETCGAACGMFLLCGLETHPEGMKYPSAELKKRNYEEVQRLAARFKEENGALLCKELLGLGRQGSEKTAEEMTQPTPEARTETYYKKRPCVRIVETAARIYAQYLEEKHV